MAKTTIKPLTPSLAWLSKLLSLYSAQEIEIPYNFREQCISIECLLRNDVSGLVHSILDFAIESGCVDFNIETSNKNLTKILDTWLHNVNSSLRGTIPTGIHALAKEYYKERWKGSSLILVRTIWENVNGFRLPTKVWIVDGKDVQVDDGGSQTKKVGEQQYSLIISRDKAISLPTNKDERVFIQRPYERWSCEYPIPFLIRRGVLYNLKFLELLTMKSSNFVGKALEYLMLMKKGDPDLAKLGKPEFIYSEEDLSKVKDSLQKMIDTNRLFGGMPTYSTNFDTELQHLIPEYKKALDGDLYTPIEKRILSGLGFIEVVEGITSTRRDAILNPKVFIAEVNSAVNDFSSILHDILMTIVEENKSLHKKYSNEDTIRVRHSPLKNFYSDNAKDYLRSIYDRGLISKRTIVELGIDVDFDSEVERRQQEKTDGIEKDMYPPVITNVQNNNKPGQPKDNMPLDKQGPEAKNYTQN